MKAKRWLTFLLPLAGLIVLAAYLNFSVLGIPVSERLTLILAFAIGPVAIIGALHFHRLLIPHYRGSLLQAATVFLVIAFAFFNLMLVVQQSIFARYDKLLSSAANDDAKEPIRLVFSLVNQVQLGIDVSFDIFYCLGLIFLAIVLMHLTLPRKILGIYGLVTGCGLLVLNLATFPVPPADSGLIDFGPATALFWIALIIMGKRWLPQTAT